MPDVPTHQAHAARPQSARRLAPVRGLQPGSAGFRVVAVGASAGGLEACAKLLDALPAPAGMAFILVQHLDPTHKSLLVELLAGHTAMAVTQATDGMLVEAEHLYVIPPGAYLSVGGGLHLSPPETHEGVARGARLPFDALLPSLAQEHGARAACVVLSGTGADGSAGLRAVKDAGGLVVVQDPAEAGYDGMPRSAIGTGLVDAVALAADIPGVLAQARSRPGSRLPAQAPAEASGTARPDPLAGIIALLRARTRHDFAPYKRGTLERRIARRMGMASIGKDGLGAYLDLLRGSKGELDLLAKDLLIHVTRFFRDPPVFHALAETVVPELVRRAPGQPVRVWIAGCSTGEEVYSLLILFREAITAAAADGTGQDVRLQVFASDIDADAVATAREGLYPLGIEAEVSAERLARFFLKEGSHTASPSAAVPATPTVFVVDDDDGIRAAMRAMLEGHGMAVEDYGNGAAFLAALRPGHPNRNACLLVDAAMPAMDGFEVLRRLGDAGHRLPAIVITGHGDVPTAVRAMKAGALDFIEKPVRAPELLAGIARALDQSRDAGKRSAWRAEAAASLAGLTGRQRDVMAMVLAGHSSKNIAADLGISQRTVENHRASIMRKTGTRSLPALARLALAAAPAGEAV